MADAPLPPGLPGPYDPNDAAPMGPPTAPDQRYTAPDGGVYVVSPNGQVGTAPADSVATLGKGFRLATQTEAQAEQNAATPPGPGADDIQQAIGEKLVRTFTGGLAPMPAGAQERSQYLEQAHPWAARTAEAVGMLPLGAAVGAGAAAAGAAVGGGLLGGAASFATGAAGFGSQIEEENAYTQGRSFSPTSAAVAGVSTELLGRAGGWALSRAMGGARNVIGKAVETAAQDDVERSLTKGGWVADYQTAQHADAYHTQLADTTARDLDSLETNFQQVAGISKKRAAASRLVSGDVQVQYDQGVEARTGLQQLRDTLANETQLGGAGRSLLKDLDDHLAKLEGENPAALSGPRLWRELDGTRQTLQNYHVDLATSLANDPGRAWASRDVLTKLDAVEGAVRSGLVRDDAWGSAAADLQRQYNAAFHEKWFPARKVVNQRLMFSPERDYAGRAVWRGEPGRVGRFLRNTDGPDAFRARELFGQYLDGAEAIVKLGQADSPQAARDALEAIRRLRRAPQLSAMVNASVARNTSRSAVGEIGLGAAAGFVGGGPVGAMFGAGVARGAFRAGQLGRWLGNALEHLGFMRGSPVDIEALLAHGALPEAAASPADGLLRDLADGPFPLASDVPRPDTSPVAGRPDVVPEGVPQPAQPEALPGLGPSARSPGRVPQGAYALKPNRIVPVTGDAIAPEAAPVPVTPGETIRPGRATVPPAPGEAKAGELPGPAGTTDRPTGFDEGPSSPPAPPGGAYQPEPKRSMPSDLVNRLSTEPTHPAPYRTEGMAWYSGQMGEGAEARAAEAARLGAMTDGEFAHVVDQLRAADVRLPDGQSMAEALEAGEGELRKAGRILSPEDALALAKRHQNEGGHVFLGARQTRVADAALPVEQRLLRLPDRGAIYDLPHADPASLSRFQAMADRAEQGLYEHEREAVGHFVGTGYEEIKNVERGLTPPVELAPEEVERQLAALRKENHGQWTDGSLARYKRLRDMQAAIRAHEHAPGLADAMEHTTVLRPTNSGPLYRGMNLPDASIHDLLDNDTFTTSSSTSTSFSPSIVSGFAGEGGVVIKFDAVDHGSIVAMGSAGQGEYEVLLPPKMRFRVTDRGRLQDGRLLVTVKQDGWATPAELKEHSALGAANLSQSLAGLATSPLALGAAVGGAGLAAYSKWGAAVSTFQQAQARLVSDTIKRLFDQTQTPSAGLPAPSVLTRSQLDTRRAEIESWAKDPQDLQDRMVTGLRDVPDAQVGGLMLHVYQTAAFLQQKLPQAVRTSSLSLKPIPVSDAAVRTYAKYEDAALNPRDAIRRESANGHLSSETLETLDRLYPDLLIHLRVAAIERLHTDGVPPTLQARIAYGRLFGGNGSLADPALSTGVAMAAEMSFEQSVPSQPPAGTTSRAQATSGPQPPAGIKAATQP